MTRAFSLRRNRAAFRRLVRHFRRKREGVAAIEFAMIAMPMITLYFGVVEVAQGVMVDRKVTQLTRALADLVAQKQSITTDGLNNIFTAGDVIMEPYVRTTAKMVVSSVVIDGTGTARVCWSSANPEATPLARNSPVSLPTDLRVPNSSVIMARASYEFNPPVGYLIVGGINIGNTPIYMRPRMGSSGSTGVEQVERVGTAMCPGFN